MKWMIALAVLVTAGCGSGTPTGPDWWVPPTVEPSPAVTLLTVTVDPGAVVGSNSARGTVRLNVPAPPGGTAVALSSSSTAAEPPATVTVPTGATTADFTIATTIVPEDSAATITARLGERSATAVVGVWALVPMSLTVLSEAGDWVGGGTTHRFTSQDARFEARCYDSDLEVTVNRGSSRWRLSFGAPRGRPLRPGVYENATRATFRQGASPGLDVGGEARGCNQVVGRFEVTDAVFDSEGTVRRFVATFEQRCGPALPATRGEIRLDAPPLLAHWNTSSCRQ
jgi:hypothetical protein